MLFQILLFPSLTYENPHRTIKDHTGNKKEVRGMSFSLDPGMCRREQREQVH